MTVGDSEDGMREFMDRGGFTFPVMLDGDSLAGSFRVRAIPTIVLLDQQGQLVKTMVGRATADQLSGLVDDLTG